jgi:hypothetical protein
MSAKKSPACSGCGQPYGGGHSVTCSENRCGVCGQPAITVSLKLCAIHYVRARREVVADRLAELDT